jgi:hypothetical protein
MVIATANLVEQRSIDANDSSENGPADTVDERRELGGIFIKPIRTARFVGEKIANSIAGRC